VAHGWEKFSFLKQADGTYKIESNTFSGHSLFMDGEGVNAKKPIGGEVSCITDSGSTFNIRVPPLALNAQNNT